ncbi:PLP-dependent aminotransferase family protein [Actinokineospora sp. UTMC 2448]|uniref:MocR-like pyridoxine biosynthesis transcription factor PdxR n=1 Tax=Actinokineospora sp. UTMC 2448 TaxID=2268449 RepID=UPI002164952F|nr:PLP-dependent aminotransferase family protein [Actinokineospora sp. UTMC 2448]UVS79069.1 HTH-type transcriptional regulatory protein GabR [Actinokineospora sp. UTMC 2448]
MTVPRTNFAQDLVLDLRRGDGPLHRQIETALRAGIRSGRLAAGTALPPTRALAADLGVSRGVVVEAYQQLVAEGYLTSRMGGYTHVAAVTATAPSPGPVRQPPLPYDFGYGRADVTRFPRAAWLRSVRRVLTEAPADRFGYLSGRGMPELREALADYLNRARGTAAHPDNIVVCSGYAQGIALLLQVLAVRGARRLAVEDPSADDDARPIAASLGMEIVGVPVDEGGVRVDELAKRSADALILTPAHQWPTGGVLPADRRAAVLRWAGEHDAIVIEDDYDAEYRYDRPALGVLQGLAPDRVVYAGSASKTLAPGMRLGWLALPAHLVDAVAAAKLAADRGAPALDQLTFADFLARGEFDRHLRRMRPIYRGRRDVLLSALRERLPDFDPVGISAGLHLVAWLPPGLGEQDTIAAARTAGVGVGGVGPYRIAPSGRGGLIFGYATLNERAVRAGIDALARVLDVSGTRRR